MSRFYIRSEPMSLLTMDIAGDKSTYFLMRSNSHKMWGQNPSNVQGEVAAQIAIMEKFSLVATHLLKHGQNSALKHEKRLKCFVHYVDPSTRAFVNCCQNWMDNGNQTGGVRSRRSSAGAATDAGPCGHCIHSSQPTSIHPGRPASLIQRLAVDARICL